VGKMETIKTITSDNIHEEHICCALADKKGETCVASKKAWLTERFKDGLVFKKLDVRGKVFIEYIPIEHAFAPVEGRDLMYINCFWVSGKYKGQGWSNKLLEACIHDAKEKGKKGLVALGSKKKMHFLSDPEYLKYKGFKVCDTGHPSFELLYLAFGSEEEKPRFRPCVTGEIEDPGVVIYYSNGCPHTDKYVPIIRDHLEELDIPHKIIKLTTKGEARNCPVPCTNYATFMKGKFISSEVLTVKKMDKFLDKYYY
jgi:predicted GNAT family acetyltransferase